MIMKRLFKRLTITAAIAFSAATFTPFSAPIASAETLPNGLTVTCSPVGENQLTCVIGGCPRVNGDYVVDIVHVMDNGYQFEDMDFKCINGQTATHNAAIHIPGIGPAGYTFGFQACRFKTFEENWCGPWSDYTWKPPARSAGSASGPAANQQQPPVKCGPNDVETEVPAGQKCTAKPPVQCPPGGLKTEVPAGESCPPPAKAVTVSFVRNLLQWTVNVKNNAGIGGSCTYNATSTSGLPGASRNFDIEPNGSASFTVPAPVGTYDVVTKCTGTYDGQQVLFGDDAQTVP
jgi:hypothetical protein